MARCSICKGISGSGEHELLSNLPKAFETVKFPQVSNKKHEVLSKVRRRSATGR